MITFTTACEKNDDVVIEEETNILKPNVRIISPETNLSLVSIDQNKIIYNSSDDGIGDVQEGDIIAAGISEAAPYGYLRKVTYIENNNGEITFHTTQASLTEVFESCDFSFVQTISSDDFKSSGPIEFLLKDLISIENYSASGKLSFTPNFIFELKIEGGALNSFRLGLDGEVTSDITLSGHITQEFQWEADIWEQELKPFVIWIPVAGPFSFPLIINPELALAASIEADGPQFELSYISEGLIGGYIDYANGALDFNTTNNYQFIGGNLEYDNSLFSTEVSLFPELDFEFYDYEGFETKLFIGPKAIGDVDTSGCATIGLDIEMGAGIELEILDKFDLPTDYNITKSFPIDRFKVGGCIDSQQGRLFGYYLNYDKMVEIDLNTGEEIETILELGAYASDFVISKETNEIFFHQSPYLKKADISTGEVSTLNYVDYERLLFSNDQNLLMGYEGYTGNIIKIDLNNGEEVEVILELG